jgi:hypothetical protein
MWSLPLEFGESLDAYFLLLHASLVILVGLALTIPTALGKNGFMKSYYDRRKDMYEPLGTEGVESLRIAEMELGSHNLFWGICTLGAVLGALLAGEDAQILCFLQLPAMASLVFYFSRVNEMLCMAASAITFVVCGYLGLQPWPLPAISVVWSPTAIFLALHCLLVLPFAVIFITGKTDAMYEAQPCTRAFMNREREILIGTQLLGGCLGAAGAVCTNGAVTFCTVVAPAFFVTGGVHWIGSGDKKNAVNNFIVMVLYGCAGLLPRIL